MAFGFRTKKKNSADVIFINGNIYTGGDDAPFVGAVAVKDEKILAVGDCEDIEELSSSDTVVHDLEGKYVYPGFIDAHSVFLRELFKDRYLELDPVWDLETVLDEVRDRAEDGDDTVFAWGFNYHILDDYDTGEDRRALLDEISTEQTIVLLASDGFTLWLNTAAMNIIEQVKEDEEADQVTVNQALHILLDYDEEDIAGDMSALSLELAEKGFLKIEKTGRSARYIPLVGKEEYQAEQSRRFLDQLFGGNLPAFALALSGSGLSREELAELRDLLDKEAL